MRTVVDLPEDLLRQAEAIALEKSWTVSQAIAWLMQRGLHEEHDPKVELDVDELTGFPLFRTGGVITQEDVNRFLDEDE